jgi:hypothetical protein
MQIVNRMKKVSLLLLFGLLMLPPAFASCDAGQRILRLSDTSNAHVENADLSNYPIEICYNEIFVDVDGNPVTLPANMDPDWYCPHECIPSKPVPWLVNNPIIEIAGEPEGEYITNAHAQAVGFPVAGYTEMCFADLECDVVNPIFPTCEDAIPGSSCVVTMSDTTNADLALCDIPESYGYKLCCTSAWALAAVPCGNGVLDDGEDCDDGANGDDTDLCTDSCDWTVCGDGVIQSPNGLGTGGPLDDGDEDCDDGANGDDTDQCFDDCTFTFCGDLTVQSPNGEGTGGPLDDGFEQCEADVDCANPLEVCQADCTCLVPLVGQPFLRITRFYADPLVFSAPDPAALPNRFSDIIVRVLNSGEAPENLRVELQVFDPVTNERILDPPASGCGVVGVGAECELERDAASDDFPLLDISSLEPGAYKLQASALDSIGAVHDKEAVFFAVARPVSLPEFSVLLLPLVAFSVLAVLFLSKRKG